MANFTVKTEDGEPTVRLNMPKFILHVDDEGNRQVASVILESEKRYQVWFGGTTNRKPNVTWLYKENCKIIPDTDIFVMPT